MTEKSSIYGSTEIVLRDALGRTKPVWAENRLGKWLRRKFGWDLRDIDIFGHWADHLAMANTITNVGHAAANGRMSNQGAYNPFVNIAIGVGTQGTPATATALASESTTNGGGRGAATATQVQTTVANDTTNLSKQWTFSGPLAITEEGIFDSASASSGSMLAYQSFSAINVVNTDQLTVTHKYQT